MFFYWWRFVEVIMNDFSFVRIDRAVWQQIIYLQKERINWFMKARVTYIWLFSSRIKGSLSRVLNKRPSRIILPTSINNFSLLDNNFFKPINRLSWSGMACSRRTAPLSSSSLMQCSSTLRKNTAETLNRVICSWLIICRFLHETCKWWDIERFDSIDNLHDCLKANEAFNNWHP